MSAYRILLLGAPGIGGPDGPVRLSSGKAQALLWYLAAQPGRLFARTHLAGLLWPESDELDARNSLSTTLARVKQALPFWPLRAEDDGLGWAGAPGVSVDAQEFAAAPTTELWRGTFLDGFELPNNEGYDHWLQEQRRYYERCFLDLLSQLVDAAEAGGDWRTVIARARQGLAADPLQERFHRALMLAYYQTGDRASALAQYAACERALGEELGLDPDEATSALRTAIVMGEPVRMPPRPAVKTTAQTTALVGRSSELAQLCAGLSKPGLVIIHGETGIGKTRLLEEALDALRRCPDVTLATGRCHEAARGLPYAPLVEALNELLAAVNLTRLGVPDMWLAEVQRLLPDIAVVKPNLPVPPALDPGQEQRRLFEGVARFLAALPRPVFLVLEDLHWADEATPEEAALDAAEELLQSGILHEVPEARSVSLVLGQDMFRRALLDAMSRTRLQYWHRRAYQALEQSPAHAPERLTYHAVAGGLWEQGLARSRETASAALRVFAYPAVVRLTEQALACLAELAPTPENRAQAVDLRLQLAQVSLFFQPARLAEWLTPALAEARALGDEFRLAQALLAQAGADYIQGRLAAAVGALERIQPAPQLRAPYLAILGQVLAARGEYARAAEILREALPLQSTHLDAAVVNNMLAGVLAYLGHFAEANALLTEQLRRDEALGDAAASREAIRLAESAENLVHAYVPGVFLGKSLARLGDAKGGRQAQERAIALAGQLHTRIILAQAHAWLGEVHLAAGRPAEAEAAARTGLAIAEAESARFDQALCLRVLGTATGDRVALAEALRQFTDLGVRPEMARCLAALGDRGGAAALAQAIQLAAI